MLFSDVWVLATNVGGWSMELCRFALPPLYILDACKMLFSEVCVLATGLETSPYLPHLSFSRFTASGFFLGLMARTAFLLATVSSSTHSTVLRPGGSTCSIASSARAFLSSALATLFTVLSSSTPVPGDAAFDADVAIGLLKQGVLEMPLLCWTFLFSVTLSWLPFSHRWFKCVFRKEGLGSPRFLQWLFVRLLKFSSASPSTVADFSWWFCVARALEETADFLSGARLASFTSPRVGGSSLTLLSAGRGLNSVITGVERPPLQRNANAENIQVHK